jgi:limonene-1,2-epoxide hydrolase
MKKPMQLNTTDLIQFVNTERLLYARDGTKKLTVLISGIFEVWRNDKIVLSTSNAMEAVDKFNDLAN